MRNMQAHLHSCGELPEKLLIASSLPLLSMVLPSLPFGKREDIKVVSLNLLVSTSYLQI